MSEPTTNDPTISEQSPSTNPIVDTTPLPHAQAAAPLTGAGKLLSDEEIKTLGRVKKPAVPPRPPVPKRPAVAPQVVEQPVATQQAPVLATPPDNYAGLNALHMQPAFADMVQQALNMQRPASQKFFLVVLPDDDWPKLEEYTEIEKLITAIRGYIGKPCCLFPFLGNHMPITAGVHKYLATPTGTIPLFDIPDAKAIAAAKHGWVGDDTQMEKPPTSEVEETVEYEATEDVEFEDDDETTVVDEPMTGSVTLIDVSQQQIVADGSDSAVV